MFSPWNLEKKTVVLYSILKILSFESLTNNLMLWIDFPGLITTPWTKGLKIWTKNWTLTCFTGHFVQHKFRRRKVTCPSKISSVSIIYLLIYNQTKITNVVKRLHEITIQKNYQNCVPCHIKMRTSNLSQIYISQFLVFETIVCLQDI